MDPHSVWHDAWDIAGAFQNPLSLGVNDIMPSWLSSHLFELSSASLSEKVISSVLSLLVSTSHTEPIEGLNVVPLLQ